MESRRQNLQPARSQALRAFSFTQGPTLTPPATLPKASRPCTHHPRTDWHSAPGCTGQSAALLNRMRSGAELQLTARTQAARLSLMGCDNINTPRASA